MKKRIKTKFRKQTLFNTQFYLNIIDSYKKN